MPNTIKTISLTDDDKSYLNKLLTQSTLEIRVYQRARILLLKSEGASNKAIADKLDIGISVVKRCLNKFKENGVEASLRDNKGRGRKAEITDDDITWVIIPGLFEPPVRTLRAIYSGNSEPPYWALLHIFPLYCKYTPLV